MTDPAFGRRAGSGMRHNGGMVFVAGFAFGLLLVVLGAWQLFSPENVWRSARRRTAWEYRDAAGAQRLEPSQSWIFTTRAKGVYLIVLGLAGFVFVGWLAGHSTKKSPGGRPVVTCNTFSAPPASPGTTLRPLPAFTICDTFSPKNP